MNIYIRKQNFLLRRVVVSSIALILIIGFLNLFQGHIRNSFYVISQPVSRNFWKGGNATFSFFTSLFPSEDVKRENMLLRQENQELLSHVAALQNSLRQDYLAEGVLEVAKEHDFSLTMAHIIASPSNDDIVLIDRGSEDGIVENMPVISSENVLYGKVQQVYQNFSKVVLISNAASVVDVKIQHDESDKTPVYGAVKGTRDGQLYLDLVSTESEINEGDVLTTSALEGIFPRNLLVAQIISKDKNDLKPFQTAQVQPFLDIKNTDTLFVITDYARK